MGDSMGDSIRRVRVSPSANAIPVMSTRDWQPNVKRVHRLVWRPNADTSESRNPELEVMVGEPNSKGGGGTVLKFSLGEALDFANALAYAIEEASNDG